MGVLSHGGFAFRNCIGVHDTTESSGSIWERYDKASSRVMTFEQKKNTTTHIEQVFGDEGSVSILFKQAGGSSIGAELCFSARSFFHGKYPGQRESQHKATGLGRHSGCLVFYFSELMARDGSWLRAVLWGCKYRAHIYVIIIVFSLFPFYHFLLSLYYG
ncbi:hypothetical protein F4774DRAFT_76008 [Daldinia eschscholtzii]|nr:hypothetical protein F4774DRAFT_76008 [Daldinia eschscholtzii]